MTGNQPLILKRVFPVVTYGWESWTIKQAEHQRIDAFELWLEKTLESPLDSKEIQPVHPKGDQSWIFTGRTDAEAETPILWSPHAKNGLIGKDPDAGKDWMQEEKGKTEEEMVGWHHQLDRHEFEQALGDGDGQGSLACCSPWGLKELDTTEWLSWTLPIWTVSRGKQKSWEEASLYVQTEHWFPIDCSKEAALLRMKPWPRSRSPMNGLAPSSLQSCAEWQNEAAPFLVTYHFPGKFLFTEVLTSKYRRRNDRVKISPSWNFC